MKSLIFRLMMIFVLGQLVSCSGCDDGNPNSSRAYTASESHPGMLEVKSSNDPIVLGTNDTTAKANERPKMKVILDYDYLLGKTEVTCGEFNSLMKKETGLTLDCSDDDIPATDITYYDAVLFANARSKAEKYDTAYTYSKAYFDEENHCISLDVLAFHPYVEAYRLPTEAEWVGVAKYNWNTSNGWTADNSDYKLHTVCSKADSSKRFCDLIGNSMEWVNDWLGNFRDTTLTNYVGAPDAGAIDQRVVKGGSYRNEASSIHIYNRGDVYTVTSSTRADYVGFRLAFGAIPEATWMGSDGASTSRLVLLENSKKVCSLVGIYNAKLAFRNDITHNLAYVDYTNAYLLITEIADTLDVYHPDISPDGNWVAFCTKFEGVNKKSELYVRRLNLSGSNLVKLDVESAAIPRWRVLDNGDTVITYVTNAGSNKEESAFESASTWQVKFSDGKFGKPQKLFNGAYHGGISEDNTLAVTGSTLLRVKIAKSGSTLTSKARDTIWYDSLQACNVSLANDGSKRVAFLDFAGKKGIDFVGKKYKTHERLLIADSTGKLIQSIPAPTGYTFDHAEWTHVPSNFIVTVLVNSNEAHQKIALVNVSDSSIVELVEGEEIWHPCLWVSESALVYDGSLDVDSAGAYFNNQGGEAAVFMRYKMELLWDYKDTANVVVLGSSRSLNGINPMLMDKSFFMINLSNVPNMMVGQNFLFTNYVLPHVKKLKYLVLALDVDLWHHAERSSYNFFYEDYKNFEGYIYDKKHKYWKDGVPDMLPLLTRESLGSEHYREHLIPTRGYSASTSNTWESKPSVEYDSTWMDSESLNFYTSLDYLEDILQKAEEYDIYVVGVIFPQSPNFKKTGALGRYGIRRSEAPALLEKFEKLEEEYPHFVFWDENKMGDHDYTDEMAANKDHLSSLGAAQLTSRLDSLLKTLR